jgi:hypothetical protein
MDVSSVYCLSPSAQLMTPCVENLHEVQYFDSWGPDKHDDRLLHDFLERPTISPPIQGARRQAAGDSPTSVFVESSTIVADTGGGSTNGDRVRAVRAGAGRRDPRLPAAIPGEGGAPSGAPPELGSRRVTHEVNRFNSTHFLCRAASIPARRGYLRAERSWLRLRTARAVALSESSRAAEPRCAAAVAVAPNVPDVRAHLAEGVLRKIARSFRAERLAQVAHPHGRALPADSKQDTVAVARVFYSYSLSTKNPRFHALTTTSFIRQLAAA